MIQINLFTKEKQTHREQIYGYWGKGWRGGIVRDFGMDMYRLLYLKWITDKDLLYIAQRTLLNVMRQPGWGGNLG